MLLLVYASAFSSTLLILVKYREMLAWGWRERRYTANVDQIERWVDIYFARIVGGGG